MTTTPAPKGADIDNDTFRELLGAYSESVDRSGSRAEADEELFIAARRDLIAYINEQLEQAGSSTSTSQGSAPGDALDAARLEFMMEREAWIAWGKDGESCRLFHRNEDDGEPMPMLGWGARHWSHDPREAIDAAIAASTTQEGAKQK